MNLSSVIKKVNAPTKQGQFIRFIIVGTLITLILYLIYLPLTQICSPSLSYTLASIVSITSNFFLTSYFTFKQKPSLQKSIGFLMQQGFNYVMQLGFLNFFIWIGIPKEAAPFPVFIIALPLNFLLLRFVFKHTK
ncbi:MAG: GtrA family protein [Tannerellaceae bacterium]